MFQVSTRANTFKASSTKSKWQARLLLKANNNNAPAMGYGIDMKACVVMGLIYGGLALAGISSDSSEAAIWGAIICANIWITKGLKHE